MAATAFIKALQPIVAKLKAKICCATDSVSAMIMAQGKDIPDKK